MTAIPPSLAASQSDSRPDLRSADGALVDLLRVGTPLGVGDLAASLGVTATAVRQRLDRLMRTGLVERTTVPRPRGRPAHVYSLTPLGRRTGGDNFRDLAVVLWREIRGVREPSVRRGLLSRIGAAMAGMYRGEVQGDTSGDRLRSVAAILQSREISCDVAVPQADPRAELAGGLPVLTSYACPYPDLAEQDRGICAAERLMLQDLVGAPVALSDCRLDGGTCCRFTVGAAGGAADSTEGAGS
jgi:DeoR family suf operon transcriptional repressor